MLLPVYFLISYILYTTGGTLPAVLAGAVVAFLLLTLLITGIIVGVVLLRRANKRGKRIEKRRKSVELIECAVEAAKGIHSREEVGGGVRKMGQQSEQPRGNPSAVYAVVDKSKKKKHKKTQGGASTTTTQGADTEEQHYEWSSGFGQDWFGNVLEESHGDGGQESLSNDANETGPQTGPHNSGAVYEVVDKSKKGNKGKKNSEEQLR